MLKLPGAEPLPTKAEGQGADVSAACPVTAAFPGGTASA